jgi:ElaB/YqjD/DUF883 family membrane-anchored ribosome-binding protein
MDQTNHNNGQRLADSRDSIAANREQLMDNLKNVIDEAEDWLRDTANGLAEDGADVKARFEDTLRTARQDLLKLEDSVIARTKLAARSADEYVHENPWRAIIIGATVGLLAGVLISRK